MSKSLESTDPAFGPPPAPLRALAVAALLAASRVLDRWASRLAKAHSRAAPPTIVPPAVEFHADVEAAAGALYVDGQLVGYLPGVRRL